MSKRLRFTICVGVACTALVASRWCAGEPVAIAELGPAPTWNVPTVSDVRNDVTAWMDKAQLEIDKRAQIVSFWPSDEELADNEELVERLAATFAIVEPRVEPLIDMCNQDFAGTVPPKLDWLADASPPALLVNNLRLFYASWLARAGFYDECLQTLDGLITDDVADPAGLLFYTAVSHHRLVQTEPCNDALATLRERERELPERYQELAKLMQLDIRGLEVDSLDHIARRMSDIEHRLNLGQADEPVRKVEDGVIESLDKLIKKAEEQQQQQQQRSAGRNLGPRKPMEDSQIAGGKGPGKVAKKFIGDKSGWGDLPAKEREKALQEIGRDFPSHYRDVVKQYFRRLATEEDDRVKPN